MWRTRGSARRPGQRSQHGSLQAPLTNLMDLWSAWNRPGGQTPRRSWGGVLDPRFRIGNSSAKTVQTGMWSRSDRAGTAKEADGT